MGGKYIGSISINAQNFEEMLIRLAIRFLAAGLGGNISIGFCRFWSSPLNPH
tara:strand:- start:110 stop:265 length:156 start_codon:yes stop_codon:yes gene_type:complete